MKSEEHKINDEVIRLENMNINFGIITISDRSAQGVRKDQSGPALVSLINQQGGHIVKTEIIPDDYETIKRVLMEWCELGKFDILLTTGGTGFSPRDVTPEATLAVIDRNTPGLVEAMRASSLEITPHAMLSRAVSGIRKTTLIINLPGSPKAATENFLTILPALPHAVSLIREDPSAEMGHKAK
jgi:molybdopterin adenylyltransferase